MTSKVLSKHRFALLHAISTFMPKKSKQFDLSKDLWINPRSNIKGPNGNRAWDYRGNITPSSGTRFLELADIALGLKRSAPRKKVAAAAASAHGTGAKTEPYSR